MTEKTMLLTVEVEYDTEHTNFDEIRERIIKALDEIATCNMVDKEAEY